MLPATVRLPSLGRLIEQESYFVIHAPRQTGKTTAMLALARELTASGSYAAIMVSAEVGQPFSHSPGKAEIAMLDAWRGAAQFDLPKELQPPPWPEAVEGRRIGAALQAWSNVCPRPLVLFIDEIDALMDDALMTVLRQLRDGYPRRPGNFPHSLALIGLRDVRDYKIASGGSIRLQTASPFNIKVESLTLRNFNKEEVAQLYGQHTTATGQTFTIAATDLVFDLTQGQPWLVNALARQVVEVLVPDSKTAITFDHIQEAKEILIQRQDTHLDSLAERLREDRVRAIIEPILAGQSLPVVSNEDLQYVLDLGLCRLANGGGIVIANPIYQEVLPRVLGSRI